MERATGYCQQALDIALEIGDRRGEGRHLTKLVDAHRSLGQLEQAIGYYRQALSIARGVGDRHGDGNALGDLGNVYSDLEQVERASEYYQQALAIAQEIGDRRGEAIRSWNIGLLYEETNPAQAVELMSVFVAYEREIGHPNAEADAERVAHIQARLQGQ
jgi:tetratricopeptide (TPR) repeat protein